MEKMKNINELQIKVDTMQKEIDVLKQDVNSQDAMNQLQIQSIHSMNNSLLSVGNCANELNTSFGKMNEALQISGKFASEMFNKIAELEANFKKYDRGLDDRIEKAHQRHDEEKIGRSKKIKEAIESAICRYVGASPNDDKYRLFHQKYRDNLYKEYKEKFCIGKILDPAVSEEMTEKALKFWNLMKMVPIKDRYGNTYFISNDEFYRGLVKEIHESYKSNFTNGRFKIKTKRTEYQTEAARKELIETYERFFDIKV